MDMKKLLGVLSGRLETIFYKMLLKQQPLEEKQALKVTAVILSWGIYGAFTEWRKRGEELSPETFIKSALPFILSGVNGK